MDVRAGHGSQATEKGAKTGEPAQAGALKTAQQLQEIGPLKFQRFFFIVRMCETASLKVKKYEREEV